MSNSVLLPSDVLDFNPPYLYPDYKVTIKRAPERRLLELPRHWFHDIAGPSFGHTAIGPNDHDLTKQHDAPPIGQRIVLDGRVVDGDGRGVPGALIELWQANAAGRYVDAADPGYMPVDPNFTGAGRYVTDSDGHYQFITIRPAAYTGRSPLFRPAHIHVSVCGPVLGDRLVTQCYFPDDPLLARDPIFNAIPDVRGRERLIMTFDNEATPSEPGNPDSALLYRWDIAVRGPASTPLER
jgi:protocatechuate 3,4-dioxygenase, beta subunit